MSRHRAAPPPRRAEPPNNRHRATAVKPRYGRLAVAGTAVAVTAIALLGGVGVLPSVATGSTGNHPTHSAAGTNKAAAISLAAQIAASTRATPSTPPSTTPSATAPSTPSTSTPSSTPSTTPSSPSSSATPTTPPPVPADSGSGKRIVFSQGQQRVWLVDDDGTVQDTYLVSGSVTDNLQPGEFHVYSRSEDAVGVDDSGTMKYFVRFTQGPTGAAIGFHDIPIFDGNLVQTRQQLGTPESHGCIRQYRPDAIELWNFAPIGTEVDVVSA